MKSIKKILSAVLVLAMVLSLTACSKSGDSEESSSASKEPSSESSVSEASKAEGSKPESEASKAESEASSSEAESSSEESSSSDSTSTESDSVSNPTPAPAAGGAYEDECRNILPTYLDIIDQFEAESCGAAYDQNTYYVGVYASEEDRTNQIIESIIPESEVTDDMIADGGSGDGGYFCLVTNATSNEELKERMSAYMTSDCLEKHYSPLQEYNGQLYLRRGGKGYDLYDFDANTAILTYTADNCYTAEVDAISFGETVGTLFVNMEKIDGNWLITDYSL